MEIVNFFETLAGKWFSQRTTHYLKSQTSRSGQSNLLIEFLPQFDPAVVRLCEQLSQDSQQAVCGLKLNHDSRMDGDVDNTKSTSYLVAMHPNDQGRGRLLQLGTDGKPSQGEYLLENEVLSMVTAIDGGQVEERLWYVNPNLRMRTSTLTQDGAILLSSFCSEIRMGMAAPSPES